MDCKCEIIKTARKVNVETTDGEIHTETVILRIPWRFLRGQQPLAAPFCKLDVND